MIGFPSCFPFLLCAFLFSLLFSVVSPCTSCLPSANMAHPSTYGRTAPQRSRSRDDPMWHSHHSQHRGRRYDPRPEVPPAPRLRKVLAIVDLQSVRPLMTKTHDDVMDATTCEVSPALSRVERKSPVHLQCLAQFSPSRILHGVQPSLLRQPAHLVHVGSLLTPVFHGYPMAR